jgi:hypothetical protein
MKISQMAFIAALIAIVAGAAFVLRATENHDSQNNTGDLGVDQLAKSPKPYADQEVKVLGVVAGLAPDENYFTIIDVAEYQACKVVTCSQYQIPVAFAGELPQPEQTVRVTGQLTQPQPGRFLVQATRVETLP